jgi:hypothetical protein
MAKKKIAVLGGKNKRDERTEPGMGEWNKPTTNKGRKTQRSLSLPTRALSK